MTVTDPQTVLATGAILLATVVVVAAAALKGWSGWLDLRRLELQGRTGTAPAAHPAARIELADLKERVRKLEAIAAGVEL